MLVHKTRAIFDRFCSFWFPTGMPSVNILDILGGKHRIVCMIHRGDRVYIRLEYQDAGDDRIVFTAIEDEDGGRVRIQAELGLPINPTSVVRVEMLDNVE